jgi:hypothetical protein
MSLQVTFVITLQRDFIAPGVVKWRVFDLSAEFNFYQSDYVENHVFILR